MIKKLVFYLKFLALYKGVIKVFYLKILLTILNIMGIFDFFNKVFRKNI
jgi:hypothetical protein